MIQGFQSSLKNLKIIHHANHQKKSKKAPNIAFLALERVAI